MASAALCGELWREARGRLCEKLDADTFERYFASITPLSYSREKQEITLGVASDFVALWLDSNYSAILLEVMTEVVGTPVSTRFEGGHEAAVEAAPTPTEAAAPTPVEAAPERGGPRNCRPDFTFDSFVTGANCQIPVAAAHAVCKKLGKSYNPLFIYGGVGLGKTHLLQAIANDVAARRKRARIEYLTSEEFLNQYVEALQQKTLARFRRHFRSLDVLLIDDVQFFEGKVGLSEEFFHTFNTLHNSHRQIVLASDRTPQEISGVEQRLVSRFDWGLSAQILPPVDLETRVAILKKKQEVQNIKLPDDILYLIAERIRSNIRNLESALTRLIMNISTFDQRAMTVELAEQLLQDKFENENSKLQTVDAIQRRVAEHFDIRVADMTSQKRPRNIAVPRMLAMYLSRKLTKHSLPAIGEAFNRNHATILHGISATEKRMDEDNAFRHAVGLLTRQLQS